MNERDSLVVALNKRLADLDRSIEDIDVQVTKVSQEMDLLLIEKRRLESHREDVMKVLDHSDDELPFMAHSMRPEISSEEDGPSIGASAEGEINDSGQVDVEPVLRSLPGIEEQSGYRARSSRRGIGQILTDHVFDILKKRELEYDLEDRALHYQELVGQLQAMGVFVSGDNPGLNLISHMHNDKSKRFHRASRGHYGLAEWYPDTRSGSSNSSSRRRSN